MSRRPPPKRKSKATVKARTEVKKNKETVHQGEETFVRDVLVKPGEARVSVGHGKKYWCSTQADGLTVESTCHVSLGVDQDLEEIEKANEQASELAYVFMRKNYKRVLKDVDDFNAADPRKR